MLPFAAFQLLQAFSASQLSVFKVQSGWQLHPAPKEGVVIFQSVLFLYSVINHPGLLPGLEQSMAVSLDAVFKLMGHKI